MTRIEIAAGVASLMLDHVPTGTSVELPDRQNHIVVTSGTSSTGVEYRVVCLVRPARAYRGEPRWEWTPLTWPPGVTSLELPDYSEATTPQEWRDGLATHTMAFFGPTATRNSHYLSHLTAPQSSTYGRSQLTPSGSSHGAITLSDHAAVLGAAVVQALSDEFATTARLLAASPIAATRAAASTAVPEPPSLIGLTGSDAIYQIRKWANAATSRTNALIDRHGAIAVKAIHTGLRRLRGSDNLRAAGYEIEGFHLDYMDPMTGRMTAITTPLVTRHGRLVETPQAELDGGRLALRRRFSLDRKVAREILADAASLGAALAPPQQDRGVA